MGSVSKLSSMAAFQIEDPWRWFCGASKSPSDEAPSCSKSIHLVGLMNVYSRAPESVSSTCIQHGIVCFGQILLLFVFFILLATSNSIPPGALTGADFISTFEVGSILYNVTSVLSGLVGVAHVVVGMYLYSRVDFLATHEELYLLVQGLAWFTIAISLRIRLRNPTKQVAYVWWILTFLLTSLTGVLILINLNSRVTIPLLELFLVVASWPVACLLLACSIRGERWIALEPEVQQQDGLTEPLLIGVAANRPREVKNTEESFYATASPFSALIFKWLDPFLALGYKRPLGLKDVPYLNKDLQAQSAVQKFLAAWNSQKERHPQEEQSVFWALATVYWKTMAFNGFCALGKTLTLASGPIFLHFFIKFEGGERLFKYEGYALVAALFFSKVLESIFQRHWYAGARMVGMELRSGLIALIYEKQLRLSNTSRASYAAGEVVNYVSVDCYRLGEFP